MQISASLVKELRERTSAGMMECKKALVEMGGDLDAAAEHLRKSGQAKADKKSGRVTAQGLVGIATRDAHGAMVEVNCETDFVAKEERFGAFVQAVADCALRHQSRDVDALLAHPIDGGGASVEECRRELIGQLGENITVRRVARLASQSGNLGAYSHLGRIGVLVDLEGGDAAVSKDVAMHVAASRPLAISKADLPARMLEKEREILLAQVADSGKPAAIQEKIVSGRLGKYVREITLLGQPFVKDPDQSVEKYLKVASASVRAMARFEVGEGIEKKAENFAAEVMAQVRGSEAPSGPA